MKDYVNEHLRATIEMDENVPDFQKIRPRLVCADGADLSIQAGRLMYSTPRQDGTRHYTNVEIGYPSIRPPDTWAQYAEQWDLGLWGEIKDLVGTVYHAIKWGNSLRKFTIKHALEQFIKGKPLMTVYPYIPIELVNEFIEEHGGAEGA